MTVLKAPLPPGPWIHHAHDLVVPTTSVVFRHFLHKLTGPRALVPRRSAYTELTRERTQHVGPA